MSDLRPVRGTHDWYGEEAARYECVVDQFRQTAALFGFSRIETPVFESLSVFDRTLGEASDIVSKEMYVFEDRGGEKLSLRPEGTAGVVRAFLSNGLQRNLPLKLYYSGPMFRYERPQKGRYRQFYQVGIEFLGVDSPLADIEILQLAHAYLQSLNLTGNIRLCINSLGSTACRDRYRTLLVDYYKKNLQSLSEDSRRRLETNPLRILDSKDEGDRRINEGAPKLQAALSEESSTRFKDIQSSLTSLNIPFQVDDRLVRGLDYYNDLVFEFKTDSLGAQDAVLSGGRYDSLVRTMGGPETPGVGFAAGVERLMMLLKDSPQTKAPVAIAPMSPSAHTTALSVAKALRDLGQPVDFIHSGNMSNRLKKAVRLNAKGIVIIGDDELKEGLLTYKDLIKSEQKQLSLKDLQAHFR